ncbi:MAG: hypothetical protein JNL67_03590 [Planctomycetaceae bacterium]|nr:hypothetical protein [Planctomycetaceae bacterium]
MPTSANDENWNCPHCGHQHQERPFAIDDSLQCQRCNQWFPAHGTSSDHHQNSALELLDDQELFQSLDLTGIDSDPDTGSLRFDSQPPRAGQMVSVRCRVCDTLQYVELKPQAGIKCEVCFAPIPLNPDGTPVQMKGKSQWTPATHPSTARNVSAEAVGRLGDDRGNPGDEIDELIKDVRSDVEGDFQIPETRGWGPTTGRADPGDDSSEELVLQPLEDRGGMLPDLLYLQDDVKSELFADPPSPIEVDDEALIPLEELPEPEAMAPSDETTEPEALIHLQELPEPVGAIPLEDLLEPEPLEAVLDELPTTGRVGPPAFPVGPEVSSQDRPANSLIDVKDGPIDWDSLNLAPLESGSDPPKTESIAPLSPAHPKLATDAKAPPVFSVPPVVESAPQSNTSSKADRTSHGSKVEQATSSDRAVGTVNGNVSWDVWRDLMMPFTSPWLIGAGLLLLPLIYWAQLSWRLAIDDGTTFQKLVGYLSVLFSSILVLPVWCALLGVIANRPTSVGQAGRLTVQAVFAQACQFAMALCCWVPGAALATITMHYLTIGCGGAITMLIGGLYLVTTAVVANEMFAGYHPHVMRSLKEQHADWALAAIIVGGLLMVGIVLAIATSYSEMLGGAIFAVFVVPASMLYAATIGCLAKRVLQLDEDESQGRQW